MTAIPPSNEVKCEDCGATFKPAINIAALPLFNQARKYDWQRVNCPNCSAVHRLARFSKKEFNVVMIKD